MLGDLEGHSTPPMRHRGPLADKPGWWRFQGPCAQGLRRNQSTLALLSYANSCQGERALARAIGQGVKLCSYVQAPARACALPAGSNPWPPASLALLPS